MYLSKSKFACSYSGARSTETFAHVKRGRQHVYHWSEGKYKKDVLHASEIKKIAFMCLLPPKKDAFTLYSNTASTHSTSTLMHLHSYCQSPLLSNQLHHVHIEHTMVQKTVCASL